MRDILHQHGLTGARRRDDQRALTLAQRRDQIDDPGRLFLLLALLIVIAFDLELKLLIRIERRQVVEIDSMPNRIRFVEIDLVDLQQGEIALAILRRADLALDRIAGAQAEAADLAGRDIDVVRPGEIIRLGRAQEAEPIGQNFQNPLAIDRHIVHRQLLEAGEHQLLLAQVRGVFDLQLFREGQEFGRGFLFQFFEMHEFLVLCREGCVTGNLSGRCVPKGPTNGDIGYDSAGSMAVRLEPCVFGDPDVRGAMCRTSCPTRFK